MEGNIKIWLNKSKTTDYKKVWTVQCLCFKFIHRRKSGRIHTKLLKMDINGNVKVIIVTFPSYFICLLFEFYTRQILISQSEKINIMLHLKNKLTS